MNNKLLMFAYLKNALYTFFNPNMNPMWYMSEEDIHFAYDAMLALSED